ncbi:sulfur oxidation c-type cytochrome SoxX [Thiolapillus brandeum]|uniref:Sulfur oxidation protein SoxX n=1 Tax=Thiolapillus brandeum TaxID=1076588 RepID=A0A7U6GKD5_9GAMM|nr:sulfur oxidation c-type cytochrome SoxX [Thiolapillus brandeum]BAO45256.1 sulfur oxidation protein SoxX [Thiolapillus brandeum]
MTKITQRLGGTTTVLALCAGLAFSAQASADDLAAGKKLAFSRTKGNCLACHQIEGGDQMGNIGPPLIGMKARFPDRAKLRAQIWDSTVANPNSIMPPMGRHRILSEKEIDLVTDFIHSL